MTSDIPSGAMPKKEEGGEGEGEGEKSGGGEGEGEKPGSSDEDKSEKQGSYDLTDGEPSKEQSEVVSIPSVRSFTNEP